MNERMDGAKSMALQRLVMITGHEQSMVNINQKVFGLDAVYVGCWDISF